MTVFKAYDVRAVYPEPLNEEVAHKIGLATGRLLLAEADEKGAIVVGHDMRPSSPSLVEALKNGILASGADVIDVGMVDTPFIAFAVNHLGTIRRMLTVNGKSKEFVGEITLQELLVQLELEKTLCAIEVNNSLVPHKLRNEYTLQDGDNVEIVSLVGGG